MTLRGKPFALISPVTSESLKKVSQRSPEEAWKDIEDTLSCGLARSHGLVGEKPTQVTASHGPGIEPCRCSGNTVFDA